METKNINDADLIIFNTCGVRQMAEDRVYGQIHNIRKQKTENSKQGRKIIVLTGCLANRRDVQKKLKNKVDLFCEIKDFPKKISSLLACHPERAKRVEGSTNDYPGSANNSNTSCRYKEKDSLSIRQAGSTPPLAHCARSGSAWNDNSYLSLPPKYTSTKSAYVPIMTGCNNFCAYCVVPYARGREVSRPPEEILSEISSLVKNGYREIILLGQNVNSYRHKTMLDFPELLKLIEKIPGNFRLSFVSSHPKDYSDKLIETVARSKKICEYVHLPLQAGDDTILKNMNRKYTAEHYLKLIQKIKTAFEKYKPGTPYSITTDIIVGFPGETRKQFLESARVMEKVKYDMVYFGQFSPRPGTAAFQMKDNVSKKEKARREKFLNEILKRTAFAKNKKYVGKKIDILIDKKDGDFYFGRTRTMKNIKISVTKKGLVGKIVSTKITRANEWNLEGEIQ